MQIERSVVNTGLTWISLGTRNEPQRLHLTKVWIVTLRGKCGCDIPYSCVPYINFYCELWLQFFKRLYRANLLHCFLDFSSISVSVLSEALWAIHCSNQSRPGENKVRYRGISNFCIASMFCTLSPCTWYRQCNKLLVMTRTNTQSYKQYKGFVHICIISTCRI